MRKIILLLLIFSAIVLAAQDHRNLTPIQQNGKWGYADDQGRTVIRAQFSLAHGFSDGLALVWQGGVPLRDPVVKSLVKMGYIDQKGHWVIQSRFTYYFYYDFSEGLVSFRQVSKGWGYMDTKGKITIRPHFQWAFFESGDEYEVWADLPSCGENYWTEPPAQRSLTGSDSFGEIYFLA